MLLWSCVCSDPKLNDGQYASTNGPWICLLLWCLPGQNFQRVCLHKGEYILCICTVYKVLFIHDYNLFECVEQISLKECNRDQLSIREEQRELKRHWAFWFSLHGKLGDAQVMAPRLRSLAALCVLPVLTSGGTVIQYDALCVWLFLTRKSCPCPWKGLVSCKVPFCKWSKARYVLAEEVQDSEQIAHDCTTYQIDSRELGDRRCECFRCMNLPNLST